MAAPEINLTARMRRLVGRRIEASSRSVEAQLRRKFYPEIRTQTFDWPDYSYSPSWRLYLNQHELTSVTSITSGGTVINAADYFLRPDDGPPFSHVEIDLSGTASLGGGSTHQRDISIVGQFHYPSMVEVAGELKATINSSVTTVDINPLNNELLVGTGSIILVGTERMIVTQRSMLDTGQDLQAAITANKASTSLEVANSAIFGLDETILIDSERMKIVDISGNYLTVVRAYDGTVLAAHDGSDIYALHRYTVTRAALGTTAAAHTAGDDVSVIVFPELVTELTIAETIVLCQGAATAYASTSGSGTRKQKTPVNPLDDLRERAFHAYGRKVRLGAI